MKQVRTWNKGAFPTSGTSWFDIVGGAAAANLTEYVTQGIWPAAGVFRNLLITLTTAPGSGRTYTCTLKINGSNTACVVTISDAATSGSYTASDIAVAAGDRVNMSVVVSGGTAANSGDTRISLEFEGTTAKQSGHGWSNLGANNGTNYAHPWEGGAASVLNDVQGIVGVPGDITALYLRIVSSGSVGASKTIVACLVLEGVPQDGSGGTVDTRVTLTTGGTAANATFTLPVVAGDLLAVRYVCTGSLAGDRFGTGLQFTATTDGYSNLGGKANNSPSPSASNYTAPWFSPTAYGWSGTEATRRIFGGITSFDLVGIAAYLYAAPGSGKSRTFQSFPNGAASGPSVTIADTSQKGVGGGSVTIDQGDTVSVIATASGTPTASQVTWAFGQYIAPPASSTTYEYDGEVPIEVGLASTYEGPDTTELGLLIEMCFGGSYRSWLRNRGTCVRHWFLGETWGDATDGDDAKDDLSDGGSPSNHGTYVNSEPIPVARGMLPEFGLAAAFDGDTQAVDVTSGLTGTGGTFTVGALVRPGVGGGSPAVGSGTVRCIYQTGAGAAYLGLDANDKAVFGVNGGTKVTSAETIAPGQEWLIVGAYNGTQARLFVAPLADGSPVTTAGPTAVTFTGAHGAGKIGANNSEEFYGDLQGVFELTEALTVDDVEALQATGIWVDVTPDVDGVTPLVIDRGIHDDKPTSRLARTGTCTFAMDNSTLNSAGLLGYYSPPNSNARAGFDRNTPVRVSLPTGGESQIQFLGKIRSLAPVAGVYRERVTAIVATDWLEEAARAPLKGLATQEDVRADELLRVLLDGMRNRPHEIRFQAGSDTYPFALDNSQDEKSKVQQELLRVAMSELGLVYMQGDGTLRFEARATRAGDADVAHVLDELLEARPQRSTDQVVNRVKVTVHPRRVDPDTSTILYSADGPVRIDNGADVEIFLAFRDPDQEAARIGAVAIEDLTPTTDYLINTEEGSPAGTDVTAHPDIEVTYTLGGNGVYLRVNNGFGQPVYFTFLQVRGQGVYDYAPVTLIAEDLDSIAEDGINEVAIDMPYQARASVGQSAAELILNTFSATPTRIESVDLKLFGSADNEAAGVEGEISTRVQVVEDVAGIADEYFVNAKRITWRAADDIDVTFWLAPADTNSYWVLGVSALSETTRLGY
jgi:hypothetical protein